MINPAALSLLRWLWALEKKIDGTPTLEQLLGESRIVGWANASESQLKQAPIQEIQAWVLNVLQTEFQKHLDFSDPTNVTIIDHEEPTTPDHPRSLSATAA